MKPTGTRLLVVVAGVVAATICFIVFRREPEAIAFVNVNVVPMDSERLLERQTVIVRDGRISEMGPADRISIPRGATRIDGTSRFLMPGLVDMHSHLHSPHEFPLYLANGVTTV